MTKCERAHKREAKTVKVKREWRKGASGNMGGNRGGRKTGLEKKQWNSMQIVMIHKGSISILLQFLSSLMCTRPIFSFKV